MLKIDMHSHMLPERMPAWSKRFGYGDFIELEDAPGAFKNMMKGGEFFRRIGANCWDAELRIEEYARFQTQVQVVCTIPVMFSYWAKAADALELSRFLNDHLAEIQERYPRHYIALGTLPMQDADLSIGELERLADMGIAGVQIGSNVNDLNLGEEQFFPIFQACERLNMAVLIHPWNMMGMQHMRKYWLPWLVGMPAETSRAMCSMIFSGLFDRLPGLKVNFSHAGGSFMGTIGRIEHGFNCRPDLVAIDNPNNPRQYLGRFWVDSITHDPAMLTYILALQGSSKVCLGSDYPFPLGDLEIGRMIGEMGLEENTVRDLYHRSTLAWLGLEETAFSAAE